ncbi:Homeobox protein, partial [Schistosoma japonicum]
MDIVQKSYGLTQNDQTSTDHQITKYINITNSDSISHENQYNLSPKSITQSLDLTMEDSIISTKISSQSDIKCSSDKYEQDFSQIKLLSNSFHTIVNDKENLTCYHQYKNMNKCYNINDCHQFQRDEQCANSLNDSPSCTAASNYIQIQEDSTDYPDKDEYEIRRKRRKQILPQQNFHFTPLTTNNNSSDDLLEVEDDSRENELSRYIDCRLNDDDILLPKIRRLSTSALINGENQPETGEVSGSETKEYSEGRLNDESDLKINLVAQVSNANDDHMINLSDELTNKASSPINHMNSDCNKLINELSQYAVEAFRRSLTAKSTKVHISLDNKNNKDNCNDDFINNNNNNTESLFEQTLLKLQPHISELVGQSLRTSIETLKKEMLANLQEIKVNLNENNNLSTDLLTCNSEINTDNVNCEKLKISFEETFDKTSSPNKHTTDIYEYDNETTPFENLSKVNSKIIIPSFPQDDIKRSHLDETLKISECHSLTSHLKQHIHDSPEFSIINTEKSLIEQMNSNVNLLINKQNLSSLISQSDKNVNLRMEQPTESEHISVVNNNLLNVVTSPQTSPTLTHTIMPKNSMLRLPVDNLASNSSHQMDIDYSTCNTMFNDSSSCNDTVDFHEQTKHVIDEEKQNFPQNSLFLSDENEDNRQPSKYESNDLSVNYINSLQSPTQSTDFIQSNQSTVITSTTDITPSILTNTNASSPSSCNAVTAAAAAAALVNVLGFPIPYGWPPKLLTDLQDSFGVLPNPYHQWPWKFLNSACTSKYSDTLLKSSSLVNSTMNIINQLNKINTDSAFNSCLNPNFSFTEEDKQNNKAIFNNKTNSFPQVLSSDEQTEAIPLVVRHDRKLNKSDTPVNSTNITYNSGSANSITNTIVTTTPITINENNLFHGPVISRRRRTKVTDTRLTNSRVSRYPSNAVSNCISSNSVTHHNSRYNHNQPLPQRQQQPFLQPTSGIIDFGQAFSLFSPTSTSFGFNGNQQKADEKEFQLINRNLLTGINQPKCRNTLVSINSTCNANSNTIENLRSNDLYSTKCRSENQLQSSGSNNSRNSKEPADHTTEDLKEHCQGNVDTSESGTSIGYQNNGSNENLHCLDTIHEYESFEKVFTKAFKSYSSFKPNLMNNTSVLPTVMRTVASPTSSIYSPFVHNDSKTSFIETNVTSLPLSSPLSTHSCSNVTVPANSSSSSVYSDINQRRFLSKFNQICLLNSRLSSSLPPIPPIFFNPTENILDNNFNRANYDNMNINTNKFSASNLYDCTNLQNNSQQKQQQQSLTSQHFVTAGIGCNSEITTANSNNNNITNHDINDVTNLSSLQNKHNRQQQNVSNLNSNQHHNHINYINKLYDKLNTVENSLNIKLDKSLLLNDNFSNESTSSITLSESYQNQLINCSHELRMTTTLTPVHLRKAKLMFFYTRYPNSTLIKMYFPDVKFYKNNTAQLVKWFSNFREFYYIQMEKYARVAISEGIRMADEIHVTVESEIYRALNLHYNRNQQLEVPDHFRIVVEATLREFFNALYTGKDSEQSWKKPIYKVIARMDQPVPEFFK